MKIAVFASVYPSLSESFVADQVQALCAAGHEVDVWALPGGPGAAEELQAQPRLRPWPASRAEEARLWTKLSPRQFAAFLHAWRGSHHRLPLRQSLARAGAMAKTYHYDVLLAHFGPNGERVSLLQRAGLLSGALAVVFHGHDMSRYPLRHGQDVYRDVLQDAELLLPISERWRGVLLEMGALPHKIAVQRMGVVPHDDFVHHLPEEGTPLLIAGVARLVPKKGMDDAIVALGHLGGALPFRFELIGDGPERARLEALALDHKVPVLFRGAQGRAEVQELLGRSHAFLAPSKTSADGDQEGIPVAIMEAMSAGLTVVTTRHSGIAELVADGETGFLADEAAPEDLARTLLRAYEQRSRWREIQTQARAFVREHFDQTRWNHTLLERLSQLAERTRAQRS